MKLDLVLSWAFSLLLAHAVVAEQSLRDRGRDPSGGPAAQRLASIETGVSVRRQQLNAGQSTIWTTLQIPVCWENPTPADETTRTAIRNRITATWEANSEVRFTGWGQCVERSKGIRILLGNTNQEVAHVLQLGSAIDGVKNGMFINLNRKPEISAVHEFGHALGFAHEQNRADSPAWCRDKAQGASGDIYMTPWDKDSVMNYCNPVSQNNGRLSAHDIAGLQFWYGPTRPSGTPWVPDCRNDVVLFQDIRYAGRGVIIRGSMQELGVETFNDATSSLCIPSGYSLVVYEHNYFSGRSKTWHGPYLVIDLTRELIAQSENWNDRISSLELISVFSGNKVYEAQHECYESVLLFGDWHFAGPSISAVGNIPDLTSRSFNNGSGFNDLVTSLCVPKGKTLTLYEHINYQGAKIDVVGPTYIQTLDDRGWNDKASSIQIH